MTDDPNTLEQQVWIRDPRSLAFVFRSGGAKAHLVRVAGGVRDLCAKCGRGLDDTADHPVYPLYRDEWMPSGEVCAPCIRQAQAQQLIILTPYTEEVRRREHRRAMRTVAEVMDRLFPAPVSPLTAYIGLAVSVAYDLRDPWQPMLASAVEASYPGYQRALARVTPSVGHEQGRTVSTLDITNVEPFMMPAEMERDTQWWWALYDRASEGNLLAAIPAERASWVAVAENTIAPYELRWVDGEESQP